MKTEKADITEELEQAKTWVLESDNISLLNRCDIKLREIVSDCHVKLISLKDEGNITDIDMREAELKARLNMASGLLEICLEKKADLRKQKELDAVTETQAAKFNYQFRITAFQTMGKDWYEEITEKVKTKQP